MRLSLLVFSFSRNYFSKVARSEPAKPARKQNITRNIHSNSFKVMHFGITEKPTTDCIYRYIITLASFLKFREKIANENAENWRSRQLQCRLTPPPQGTSANMGINLTPPKTRIIGLHFCRWWYGSVFIQIFVVGSERCIFSATEYVSAVQDIQGRWFCHQSKGRMRLPISH